MKEEDIRPQALFNRFLELAERDVERFFSERSGFVCVPCPGCTSEEGDLAFEKHGFSYRLCGACGSLYVSPRPTPSMIDTYYREGESVRFWATDFFAQTAEARRERIFKPRARMIAEWAEREGLEGTRFVDVGSGYGVLLEEVAALGTFDEIMGIEPSPPLADVCREKGFSVIEETLESCSLDPPRPAFATSFELLEHVYDPARFLTALRGLLAERGIFVFTTLTVSGFDIQVLWMESKSVYPPHHLNLLSIDGMTRLVERCGLEIRDLSTPGELDVDIVRNALAEDPDIPLSRFIRQIIETDKDEVRSGFQKFLKQNRLSSHIRLVVRCSAN